MGFTDRFTGGARDEETADPDEPQEFRIVAKTRDGKRHGFPDELEDGAWQFPAGQEPTKEQFLYEWGELLDPGVEYILGPKDGRTIDFGNITWALETEPERGRDDALVEEIRRLEAKIEDGGASGDIEERIIEKALSGELASVDRRAIDNAKELSAAVAEIKGGGGAGIFDNVNDKTDVREVLATVGLSVLDDPSKLRELTKATVQGAREGAFDDGPPQPPGQEREEPEPEPQAEEAAEAGAAPRPAPARGESPPGRERAEQLLAEAEAEGVEEPETEQSSTETPADLADGVQESAEEVDEQPPADTATVDVQDGGDDEPTIPANATELDELGYREKADLASHLDYPGNPYSKGDEILRDWLVGELFGDEAPAEDAQDAEAGPETHSAVQASPEVADAIEDDSGPSEDVAADGGESE